VVEHAFPRVVGGNSEAATSAEDLGCSNTRKTTPGMRMSEVFRLMTPPSQSNETKIRNQTSQ
jgi:hypothetical protein